MSGLTAFIDESGSDRALDPYTYMLGAAIYRADAFAHIRDTMRSHLLPGQSKVHWRDEDTRRRITLIDAVASLEGIGLVVVRNGRAGEKDGRRRRLCCERLYYELDGLQVQDAWFESRGRHDDKRDRNHLDALKARKLIEGSFRINHLPGKADPLLWVPDILCGAMSQARTGNPTYMQRIESTVKVVTIDA